MSSNFDAGTSEATPLDLFGQPILPIKDRRGRPSFAKSKENQELVTVLRLAGWTHERIAQYIGCDDKTLRKHFSRELEIGADIVEAEALMVTYRKMRTGNSVATTRILDLAEKAKMIVPRRQKREPEVGKKEQALREAHRPDTGTPLGELMARRQGQTVQ